MKTTSLTDMPKRKEKPLMVRLHLVHGLQLLMMLIWIIRLFLLRTRSIILLLKKFMVRMLKPWLWVKNEQPLEQPIIKPVKNIKFEVGVKDSSTYVSTQFLISLMSNPSLVCNVALVEHL
ncbi:hypothetical protein REPUB_Repub09cG0075000 [Reevesia pubescens]